jgi:hypothetical protein
LPPLIGVSDASVTRMRPSVKIAIRASFVVNYGNDADVGSRHIHQRRASGSVAVNL